MKKVISIVLVTSMLGFVMQVNGENKSSISYDQAKAIMLSNNRTIKKIAAQGRKRFLQYSSANQTLAGLKTDGVKFRIYGREIFYKFDEKTKLNLTLTKECTPEELKYYWEMTDKTKTVTENSLALGLRDLYLGLIKADEDLNMANKKLALAKKKYDIGKVKFEQGFTYKLNLDESEYEFIKAQKAVSRAKRIRENMVRSLNSFVGVDIDTVYDSVDFNELTRNLSLKPLEYYTEKALKERLEIKNIEEDIRLKENKMGIITKSKLYGSNSDVNSQYKDLELEIEVLRANLEKTKVDIENEIKSTYIEIKKDMNDITSMDETLKMQTRSFEKLKKQYNQGLIPKLVLDEFEVGIDELKIACDLVVYNYNTKLLKIEDAAGL